MQGEGGVYGAAGEVAPAIDAEACRKHISAPRWWKQTEQYLCELMRTENNLSEQNEKCEKHIEAPAFI